ncbi:ubiquinol-cytochrome c reductase iron-sulfur subunit [Maribellus mangrovi]|uniref:QcrA and Rieske domain-containing protein n=1 Tax=Maribellus mangrovi TaxID=3133146 RepID=UPI0030ECE1A9
MESRRTFLRIGVVGLISFFAFIWNKLTLNHLEAVKQKSKTLPFNRNKEIAFSDEYIIVTQDNTTTVYSAHCTHLGCKIDKLEGDRFVCPCHGSQYDLQGKVLKGPAYKNLREVLSSISEDGNNITING